MKNIVDTINESVNKEVNFKVSLDDIKTKMSNFANMSQKDITDRLEVNKKAIEKAFAGKYRNVKIEVYTKSVTFIMYSRPVFTISFEPDHFVNYFKLEFGSIASYGSFKMNDDVFNIYKTIGNLLNDTLTLDILFKYFSENVALERILQDM